jgi:hypothetical protein
MGGEAGAGEVFAGDAPPSETSPLMSVSGMRCRISEICKRVERKNPGPGKRYSMTEWRIYESRTSNPTTTLSCRWGFAKHAKGGVPWLAGGFRHQGSGVSPPGGQLRDRIGQNMHSNVPAGPIPRSMFPKRQTAAYCCHRIGIALCYGSCYAKSGRLVTSALSPPHNPSPRPTSSTQVPANGVMTPSALSASSPSRRAIVITPEK